MRLGKDERAGRGRRTPGMWAGRLERRRWHGRPVARFAWSLPYPLLPEAGGTWSAGSPWMAVLTFVSLPVTEREKWRMPRGPVGLLAWSGRLAARRVFSALAHDERLSDGHAGRSYWDG